MKLKRSFFIFILSIPLALTAGGGIVSASMNYAFGPESRVGCGNDVCDLAIGPDGSWHVVWSSMSDGFVYYNRRNPGGGWSSPEQIPYSNDWGWQFNRARVAVGPDNVIHVVWGNSSNQYIFYSMMFPGSQWWYPRTVYSTSASPGCSKPSVAAESGGVAHILFERHYSGYLAISYRQMINGQAGSMITVSEYQYDNGDPMMEIGPDGVLHAVWITGGSSYIKMHYRRRFPTGFWSTEEVLNHFGGAGSPDISLSPQGVPYLSWVAFARGGTWYAEGVYYAARTGDGWSNGGAGYKVSPGDYLPEGSYEVVAQGAFNSTGDYILLWPVVNRLQYRVLSNGVWNEPSEIPDTDPRFWVNVEGAGSQFAVCAGDSGRCIWARPAYRSPITHPPQILAAGFMNSRLTEGTPGTAILTAIVDDPAGREDIQSVLAWAGNPGDSEPFILFDDGQNADFEANDQVYGATIFSESWSSGQHLFTIIAYDSNGDTSDIWPYLTIKSSSADSKSSTPNFQTATSLPSSAHGPSIWMAGYIYSDLYSGSNPRNFQMLAWALDESGFPAAQVSFYIGGEDSGFQLLDDGSQGDGASMDSIFGISFELPGHSLDGAEGSFILELGARDIDGRAGDLWPYLTVQKKPSPTPEPASTATATPTMSPTATSTPTPTGFPFPTPKPTSPPFPTPRPTLPPFPTGTPTGPPMP